MKRVMHNAIALHLEPDAQPVPEPRSLLSLASSPSYILRRMSYGIDYPLG